MQPHKSWYSTLKSQQQHTMMNSFISTFTANNDISDRQYLNRELEKMDKTLSRIHAHQYYQPDIVSKEVIRNRPFGGESKLTLPKGNTLTDALLRNSLGCDQKYAKSYMQLVNTTNLQGQKHNRIQEIKKKFTQSNNYKDIGANSKPFKPYSLPHPNQPVIDNQHQGYLKTQLIFLQKPKNQNLSQKEYYDKHYDSVTKKIYELGGMEDTLGKMEVTLKNNQIKSFKKRQILEQEITKSNLHTPKHNPFSPSKKNYAHPFQNPHQESFQNQSSPFKFTNSTTPVKGQSWVERSKNMRQTFKNRLNIA